MFVAYRSLTLNIALHCPDPASMNRNRMPNPNRCATRREQKKAFVALRYLNLINSGTIHRARLNGIWGLTRRG